MKILLHSCCADCVLKFLESVKGREYDVTIYYYNPNIHPRSEYQGRLKAIQKVTQEADLKLIIPGWSPKEYFQAIKTTNKPGRCIGCWNLRLSETAKYAKENGFEIFSSTLVTSQYQDTEKIKELGESLAKKEGIKFLVPEKVCKELCTSGFYKQSFCGCAYSLVERMEEAYLK